MCFERSWNLGFLVSAMQDWLSQCRILAPGCGKPKSDNSWRSHSSSFVAEAVAMYSDSVEERATVGCFRLCQEMAPPPRRKHVA